MQKLRSTGLGTYNMYMSMDKPIALNSTGGTRGPQVQNCENEFKKDVSRGFTPYQNLLILQGGYPPSAWELEYEDVHGQTDSAE